jgi:hypothetical protein
LPGWRALIRRAGRWGRMEGTNLPSHLRHPHRPCTLGAVRARVGSVLLHGRRAEPEIENARCPTSARIPFGIRTRVFRRSTVLARAASRCEQCYFKRKPANLAVESNQKLGAVRSGSHPSSGRRGSHGFEGSAILSAVPGAPTLRLARP